MTQVERWIAFTRSMMTPSEKRMHTIRERKRRAENARLDEIAGRLAAWLRAEGVVLRGHGISGASIGTRGGQVWVAVEQEGQ